VSSDLAARLRSLAHARQTITYGALAADLGVRVATLTGALEQMMATDTAQGDPLRAALCEGRFDHGLPARGFFLAAARLGHDVTDPVAFVAAQRSALWQAGTEARSAS